MAKGYYDCDERLLESGSETKYEEDPRTEMEPEIDPDTESDLYYPLPSALKSRSLKWSVASLVAGILSLLLCPVYYVGFIFCAIACFTTSVSRRNLGFFDKCAMLGLIIAIIGFVCNSFSMVVQSLNIFG